LSSKPILHHDVIIIGAGPGGSTLAAILAQKGVDVAIIEKQVFPWFKVGESLLPYSMDILKRSGAFEKIDSGKYIRKYGAQFLDHREQGEVYFEFLHALDEQHPFAFQVERAEFDHDLLKHAASVGAKVYQPETVERIVETEKDVTVETDKHIFHGKFLADSSGRRAMMGQQLKIRTRKNGFNNVAVFSHFENVKRPPERQAGDIIIGILPNKAWSWMIPFTGPITSVGVVVDAQTYKGCEFNEAFLRERLCTHPKLESAMADAKCMRPTQMASNYSESCTSFLGSRWILVGDAATFLDPVFSTGVHVSLQSASFAADVVLEALEKNVTLPQTVFGPSYESRVLLGVTRLKSLLRMFYDTDFIPAMKKAMKRTEIMKSFTSVVGGDAWNDENELFKMNVL
jgi:flavin-dependent dehydrogenase